MKKLVAFALLAVALQSQAHAKDDYVNRVVEAIYHAEGVNSRYPYGILSVKVRSKAEARKVCYEVVNWRYAMWQSMDTGESFIEYLSKSYCPIGAKNDPRGLNRNWQKNVNFYLNKGSISEAYHV